jgi:hypothetical protein
MSEMSLARWRLQETEFFLREMKIESESDDLIKEIRDVVGDKVGNLKNVSKALDDAKNHKRAIKVIREFYYYFDAYLCAFRSITWVMKHEFESIDGFSDWYSTMEIALRKDDEMRLLKTARDFTLHENIIPTCRERTIKIYEDKITPDVFCDIFWHITENIKKDKEVAKIPAIDSIIQQDIVTMCSNCVTKMEKIVSECEQKFLYSK